VERKEAHQIGKLLAEYFVYSCGEGEHYVTLIDRLRAANTRSTIIEAIYFLLRYGTEHLKLELEDLHEPKLKQLYQFIQTGSREEVTHFQSSLSIYIWEYEVEKIREQERYLLELLS
jgi:hypothetical protein